MVSNFGFGSDAWHLLKEKNVWMRDLDDTDAETFVISTDGTDFKSWGGGSIRHCLTTKANIRKNILMEA